MKQERTIARSVARVLIAAFVILSIPFAANQFAGGGWDVYDFVVAGTLIVGTGLLLEVAARKPATVVSAVVMPVLGAIAGASVVLGEFDDAPGLILFGIVLMVGAVVVGLKSTQRGTAANSGGTADATPSV